MIGLDTNVLVRYVLGDDPIHGPKAKALIDSFTNENPGWIARGSLLEMEWLFRRRYKMNREALATVLTGLLSRGDLVIEGTGEVVKALGLFRRGRAEFSDCLIGVCAREAGCESVYTFDRIAARDAGMELIK